MTEFYTKSHVSFTYTVKQVMFINTSKWIYCIYHCFILKHYVCNFFSNSFYLTHFYYFRSHINNANITSVRTRRIQTPSSVTTRRIQAPSDVTTRRIQAPSDVTTRRIQTPSDVTTRRIQAPSDVTTHRIQTPSFVTKRWIQATRRNTVDHSKSF